LSPKFGKFEKLGIITRKIESDENSTRIQENFDFPRNLSNN
jgi:hypothetical protein